MLSPSELWLEKKKYLEKQLAISSDPSQKFALRKQIEECEQEIAKIQSQYQIPHHSQNQQNYTNNSNSQANTSINAQENTQSNIQENIQESIIVTIVETSQKEDSQTINSSLKQESIVAFRQGAISTTTVAFIIINELKQIGGLESVELLAKLHSSIKYFIKRHNSQKVQVLSNLLGAIILFPDSLQLDSLNLIINLNNEMLSIGIPIKVGMSRGEIQELMDIDKHPNFIGITINTAARLATSKKNPGLLIHHSLANHIQSTLRASHWLSFRNANHLSIDVEGKREEKFLCYYPPSDIWPALSNINYKYDETFNPQTKNAAIISYDLPNFSDGDLNQLSQRFRAITDVFLSLVAETNLPLKYFYFSPGGDGGIMVFTDLEKKPVYDLAKNFIEKLTIESSNKNSLISVECRVGLHYGTVLLYENAMGSLRPTGEDIFIADELLADKTIRALGSFVFTEDFKATVSGGDISFFNKHFETLPDFKFLLRNIKLHVAKNNKTSSLVPVTNNPHSKKYWNIPYHRNSLFTGRNEILEQLNSAFQSRETVALTQPQAIFGLGGIGKTQTALEYCYRYQNHYKAIFWTNAEDRISLTNSFVEIANILDLPQKDLPDLNRIIAAVKAWLSEHNFWLIVLDNLEELELITDFLPTNHTGKVLLTSRLKSLTTVAEQIELKPMLMNESISFLLKRSGITKDNKSFVETDVEEIIKEMGGLPLALDQVGAFIEECSSNFTDYLRLYKQQTSILLRRRGSTLQGLNSVTVTFSIIFDKVAKTSQPATDLIKVCSFLAPEEIPENIFIIGGSRLGIKISKMASNKLLFKEAVKQATKFSLIQGNKENNTLSIHRLVQQTIRDSLDKQEKKIWIERITEALNLAFPEPEISKWSSCEKVLAHAKAIIPHIKSIKLNSSTIYELMKKVGTYLHKRGKYKEVDSFYKLALKFTPTEELKANLFNNLAGLYYGRGKCKTAYKNTLDALKIISLDSSKNINTINAFVIINHEAAFYYLTGQLTKAKELYQKALDIAFSCQNSYSREDTFPLNCLTLINTLNPDNSISCHLSFVLVIGRSSLLKGENILAVAYNNLASVRATLGEIQTACDNFNQAKSYWVKTLDQNHPDLAVALNNLGVLSAISRNFKQAKRYLDKAYKIRLNSLTNAHPTTAQTLSNISSFELLSSNILKKNIGTYSLEQHLEKAKQALNTRTKTLSSKHPAIAQSLNNLAVLYYLKKEYKLAKECFVKALKFFDSSETNSLSDKTLIKKNLANLKQNLAKDNNLYHLYQG